MQNCDNWQHECVIDTSRCLTMLTTSRVEYGYVMSPWSAIVRNSQNASTSRRNTSSGTWGPYCCSIDISDCMSGLSTAWQLNMSPAATQIKNVGNYHITAMSAIIISLQTQQFLHLKKQPRQASYLLQFIYIPNLKFNRYEWVPKKDHATLTTAILGEVYHSYSPSYYKIWSYLYPTQNMPRQNVSFSVSTHQNFANK